MTAQENTWGAHVSRTTAHELTRILFPLIFCAAALAQQPATFRTGVKEVLVPVVVRDSQGHPVRGLKAADFQIFDKGKRQSISSFTAVTHGLQEHVADASEPAEAAGASPSEPLEPARLQAPGPQTRSVAYVFDDVNTGFVEFARVRDAARRHFEAGLPAGELAGIYTFSGRTTLPFTSDRVKLEDAVNKLRVNLSPGHGEANPCPYVSYYLADQIIRRDDGSALEAVTRQTMDCAHLDHYRAQQIAESTAKREVLIGEQDTRVWAATLRRVIRLLQARPAPRVLVLASSGFYTETPEGAKAIADTLDLAARANVVVNTLHARGVYVMAPMDASRSTAPGSLEQRYYRESAHSEEGSLQELADGAGGMYFHHNNDLATGLAELDAPPEFSYVLGFSPSALKLDGSFHTLKVRLTDRAGFSIEARPGYYAPRAPKKGRTEDVVAEEIDDAVQSRDETTGIPVDAVVQVSRSGNAPPKIMVVAKVHVKPLQFARLEGRNHAVLTVVSVVFDQDGGYVVGNRNTINLMLRNETLTGKDDPAVNVQSNFEVKPGIYLVRVVVCDAGGEELSTRNVSVVVR